MNKFFKWLVLSSENPKEIALTIRGIILLSLPTIVELLNEAGIHALDSKGVEIAVLITSLFGVLLAVIGLIRKLVNTFSAEKVVVFKAKKKAKK